ncbi:MAG: hypothetical protein FJ308_05585 [Planctomycetes bacterium]|nr:hypothetical protein [Planctomycetota bacterium]
MLLANVLHVQYIIVLKSPQRKATMRRSYFCAIALLNSTIVWSLAGEPDSIVVVVPDPDTAAVVSAKVPGVRIGVLQVHADEPDEVINARALALRHATHLVFDHSNESLRMAMFRERLQMQGVVAINIRPSSLPRYKNARPASSPQIEQLASLLTQASTNKE